MTPTIEEVTRVAEEIGFDFRRCEAGELATGYASELQTFAQHYIEVGRKEQRESDEEIAMNWPDDCVFDVAEAIRNNTGE